MTSMTRTRNNQLRSRNRLIGTALVACTLLVLPACSKSEDQGKGEVSPSASPSPSKTSSSPDPHSAAKNEAVAAWKSMRKEETKAAAIGYADKTNLSHYSYDKALAQTKRALFDYRQQGVGFKGAPASTVKATSVDSAGKKVDVRECMDTTNWKPILKDSGKDISASGQPKRFVITGVVKDLGDRWMVQNYTLHKDKSC